MLVVRSTEVCNNTEVKKTLLICLKKKSEISNSQMKWYFFRHGNEIGSLGVEMSLGARKTSTYLVMYNIFSELLLVKNLILENQYCCQVGWCTPIIPATLKG